MASDETTQEWTAGPWKISDYPEFRGTVVLGVDCAMVANGSSYSVPHDRDESVCVANAQRIVACVNALIGIDDPAGLRQVLDKILLDAATLSGAGESARCEAERCWIAVNQIIDVIRSPQPTEPGR